MKKAGGGIKVNQKMPYLSFLAIHYDIPEIAQAQRWFESCIVRSDANPMAEMQIMVSDDARMKKQMVTL